MDDPYIKTTLAKKKPLNPYIKPSPEIIIKPTSKHRIKILSTHTYIYI